MTPKTTLKYQGTPYTFCKSQILPVLLYRDVWGLEMTIFRQVHLMTLGTLKINRRIPNFTPFGYPGFAMRPGVFKVTGHFDKSAPNDPQALIGQRYLMYLLQIQYPWDLNSNLFCTTASRFRWGHKVPLMYVYMWSVAVWHENCRCSGKAQKVAIPPCSVLWKLVSRGKYVCVLHIFF